MVELVQIVDEKGRFKRVATREEAHIRNLLHKSVRVLLFNKKGQLYVQQRSFAKDIDPGLWEGSLAGHAVRGEDPIKTAMRETKEELGIRIPAKRFRKVGSLVIANKGDNIHSTVYAVRNVTKTPKLGKEVIQGHWEDPKLITKATKQHKHKFRKSFLLAWKLYSK